MRQKGREEEGVSPFLCRLSRPYVSRIGHGSQLVLCCTGWTGLDWTGLDWTLLDWTGLDWAGWIGLDWTGPDWTGTGLDRTRPDWIGSDWTESENDICQKAKRKKYVSLKCGTVRK